MTKSKLYNDIIQSIQPLDLIAFRGSDFVANIISTLENIVLGSGEFSHVGIVVSRDVLPSITQLVPNRYYVLESTMTANYPGLGEITPDVISNKGKVGVQIRDLEDVIRTYTISKNSYVAHCKLKHNPYLSNTYNIIKIMGKIYQQYGDKKYERNCLEFSGSLFSYVRPFRDNLNMIKVEDHQVFVNYNTENKWYFCSELVALIYKEVGVLPKNIDIRDVAPMDLLGYDLDSEMDIVEKPIYIKFSR